MALDEVFANVDAAAAATREKHRKKIQQLEHILPRLDDTYIGSIKKSTPTPWRYDEVDPCKTFTVRGLGRIYQDILFYDPSIVKVAIDAEQKLFKAYINEGGDPVEVHLDEGVCYDTTADEEYKQEGLGTSTPNKYIRWIEFSNYGLVELVFINKEMIAGRMIGFPPFPESYRELELFPMADLQWSVPSLFDGLTAGQRKVLFCALEWNFVEPAAVDEFSSYIHQHSAYPPGFGSLAETVISMAQDFVGSNNINLLQPFGFFGSRIWGGEDAGKYSHIRTRLSPITRYLFPKDELVHSNESVEPSCYMPVIPTVLVNGSEANGNGLSSYIPKYNPRDIIYNIRQLLQGLPMKEMIPWYKGFNGTIERSGKGSCYTASGDIQVVDKTTLRITELPIKKSTEDYSVFLSSMVRVYDKIKDPSIKAFRDFCDTSTVHFEVSLPNGNLAMAEKQVLLKIFELQKTICTSNMHLFDSRGMIKKYDTPEEILEEFFRERKMFYEKRKEVLLGNLIAESLKLYNILRFINEVLGGKISLSNREPAEMFGELQCKGFGGFPKKTEAAEQVSDGNSEVVETVQAGDYDYLMSLPLATFTPKKIRELIHEMEKLLGKVAALKEADVESLWLKDLEALESQLNEQDKLDEQAEKAGIAWRSRVLDKAGLEALKAAPKTSLIEAMETSDSLSMETDNAPGVAKAKGRAGAVKASFFY